MRCGSSSTASPGNYLDDRDPNPSAGGASSRSAFAIIDFGAAGGAGAVGRT